MAAVGGRRRGQRQQLLMHVVRRGDAGELPEATITVRGTATDGGGITAVRVNGVDVVSADGFATWQVTLPLDVGTNALAVETVDARVNSNSTADTATVHSCAFPFL